MSIFIKLQLFSGSPKSKCYNFTLFYLFSTNFTVALRLTNNKFNWLSKVKTIKVSPVSFDLYRFFKWSVEPDGLNLTERRRRWSWRRRKRKSFTTNSLPAPGTKLTKLFCRDWCPGRISSVVMKLFYSSLKHYCKKCQVSGLVKFSG